MYKLSASLRDQGLAQHNMGFICYAV